MLVIADDLPVDRALSAARLKVLVAVHKLTVGVRGAWASRGAILASGGHSRPLQACVHAELLEIAWTNSRAHKTFGRQRYGALKYDGAVYALSLDGEAALFAQRPDLMFQRAA